jgi:hypothetical protein
VDCLRRRFDTNLKYGEFCSKKKVVPKDAADKSAAEAGKKVAAKGNKLPAVPESVLLRRKRRSAERIAKVKKAYKVRFLFWTFPGLLPSFSCFSFILNYVKYLLGSYLDL